MSSFKPSLSTVGLRLWALMGFVIVIAVVAAYFFSSVLDQARIGSERYRQIVAVSDLQADVTMPSLHLVEVQMSLQGLALADATEPVLELPGVADREASYDARYEAMLLQAKDPELRAALAETNAAAQSYFSEVEGDFSLAAAAGDRKVMRTLLEGPIAEKYAAHEESVDKLARLADEQVLAAEKAARQALQADKTRLLLIGLGLGLLGIALTALTLRSLASRLRVMRQVASKTYPKLVAEAEVAAESGGVPPPYDVPPIRGKDELARAERALHRVVGNAVGLAGEQAHLRHSTTEMFTYHGRRNHQLLTKGLSNLDAIEGATHSDRSSELFQLRKSLTRLRLTAEGLLVIAGAPPVRVWEETVSIEEVLTAARDDADPLAGNRLRTDLQGSAAVAGEVGAQLALLLAELLDNALKFTESEITVVGRPDNGGYELLVTDEGLGIEASQLTVLNELLANGELDVQDSRRMGLSVVARLAFRNDFEISLSHQSTGGLVARVVLPPACLFIEPEVDRTSGSAPTLSMAKSVAKTADRPTAEQLLIEVPDENELPRRIRGASLEDSLREIPAEVIVPQHRDPEAVRSSLAALAIGKSAASEYEDDHVDDQD